MTGAAAIRRRARAGAAEVFPPSDRYGRDMFGAVASGVGPWDHPADRLDNARLVPPVFMWEGSRVVKGLALGARAAGLGRAALVAVDEDPEHGLMRLVEAIALECRLLISALGKYSPDVLDFSDLWVPDAR